MSVRLVIVFMLRLTDKLHCEFGMYAICFCASFPE